MDLGLGLLTDRFSVVQMNGVPDWRVLDRFEVSLRRVLSADARDLQLVHIEVGAAAVLSCGSAPRLSVSEPDGPVQPGSRPPVTVLVTPDAELAAVLRKFATVAFWIEPTDDIRYQCDGVASDTTLVSCDRRVDVDSPWHPAGTWPY